MKLKIKKVFFLLIFVFCSLSLFALINRTLAATDSSYGLNDTMGQGNLSGALNKTAVDTQTGGPGQYLSGKVGQIIGVVLSFIGVILLILIIYAGILWMTAAGNERKVDQAKTILTSAILGLIIILAAYAITAFVGRQLTETTLQSTAQ